MENMHILVFCSHICGLNKGCPQKSLHSETQTSKRAKHTSFRGAFLKVLSIAFLIWLQWSGGADTIQNMKYN